jgi:K+-transporting ATPase ATPase B chain
MSKSPSAEIGLFEPVILKAAVVQAFAKLDPRGLVRNPVIFVTALVSVLATILAIREVASTGPNGFIAVQIALWLWFTVLFANFA